MLILTLKIENASIYIVNASTLEKNDESTYETTNLEDESYKIFQGKVISIMGDSISTFAGYIPEADGFNLPHAVRYPQNNLLMDVNSTWWKMLLDETGAKLGINDSWSGSCVSSAGKCKGSVMPEESAMTSLTRIQNLGANGTPDIILFYGGTNDVRQNIKLVKFDGSSRYTLNLNKTKWTTFSEAYAQAILRIQHFYPDAELVMILPAYSNGSYSDANLDKYNYIMKTICKYLHVSYIDLRECGITSENVSEMLGDRVHPNKKGMKLIKEYVKSKLPEVCNLEPGENVVCNISHELKNVEASLSYYKGVSKGKEFVEKLTVGTKYNLKSVTVTMGGVDITSNCYKNGQIQIEEVTGDIVIKAIACKKKIASVSKWKKTAYKGTQTIKLYLAKGYQGKYSIGGKYIEFKNGTKITINKSTTLRIKVYKKKKWVKTLEYKYTIK